MRRRLLATHDREQMRRFVINVWTALRRSRGGCARQSGRAPLGLYGKAATRDTSGTKTETPCTKDVSSIKNWASTKGIRWNVTSGHPTLNVYMADLSLDFEWADPLGARGPELRATWARLALRVDGRVASRVFDHEMRTVRDSVYVPLYPLAEWIVANWWRLLFEIESPQRMKDPHYERRHNLRWAREGYSLPSLSFSAAGELLQLRWEAEFLAHHRVEFIQFGSAYVDIELLQRTLRSFITAVVTRLTASGITNSFLQREWEIVGNTVGEDADFCVAAATLGLDPYDVPENVAEAIVAVAESIPENVRREFFSVANRELLREESEDVSKAIETARANRSDLHALHDLRHSVPQSQTLRGHPPWEIGYAAARELRKALRIEMEALKSFSDLAQALRVSSGSFLSAIVEQPSGTHAYEAIVATNQAAGPAFAVTRRHEAARRFQVCRGLYEFLAGRDDGPWIVTTGLSDRQKRNRAFAAEFLAPAAGIQEKVSSAVVSSEEVDELAQHFGVSSEAIVHQLANHRIASVAW